MGFVIKDLILLPLLIIPLIIAELIGKKDEEFIISVSLLVFGIVLIRIFNSISVGIILSVCGYVLLDSVYFPSHFDGKSFLNKFYGDFVFTNYYKIKGRITPFLNPLKSHKCVINFIYGFYGVFLISTIVYISYFASKGDLINFVLYCCVSAFVFVIGYFVY